MNGLLIAKAQLLRSNPQPAGEALGGCFQLADFSLL